MMFAKKIAFTGLLAASVYAQGTDTATGPIPSPSLTPCLLSCVTTATQCSFTDASCVCVNTEYQAAVLTCLTENCTADDIAQAQSLQASLCGDVSSVPSSTDVESSTQLSSSASSRPPSVTPSLTRTPTGTTPSGTSPAVSPTNTTGAGNGATGLTGSLLATGGAVFLGVIGGGLLAF